MPNSYKCEANYTAININTVIMKLSRVREVAHVKALTNKFQSESFLICNITTLIASFRQQRDVCLRATAA
jgi:hypothetical protein